MTDEETSAVEWYILEHDWEDTNLSRFHALLRLRLARGETTLITWDDFRIGRVR